MSAAQSSLGPGASATFAAVSSELGGYRLLRMLGRGRHTAVYLARHSDAVCPVALKVGTECFSREHALLQALAHPHVIGTEGQGEAAGCNWLALEHANAGTLAERPLPLPRARVGTLLPQAASALAALHSHGWVHRDIKPANLLLRADGTLALADFGCACPVGTVDARPRGAVIGSPRYAAPEQSNGAPADPAADVYSLGVVLFELLTGRPPFPGTTLAEIAAQHLLAPVPALPPEATHWQPMLHAMLAKNPSERPRAAQVAHFREPS